MSQSSFLDFVLGRWQELSIKLRSSGVESSVQLDQSIGKMGIEVRSNAYLVSIGAWENARCLDVDVMRIRDKSVSMLSAGPCEDNAQVELRLKELCHVIEASLNT